MRIYVKGLDGVTRKWKMNMINRLVHRVRNGWFTYRSSVLDEKRRYHLDPKKYELHGFRPIFPWFMMVERFEPTLYYHEGFEEPFLLASPSETKGNARDLQIVTEAAYGRNMLPQPLPWAMIILALVLLIGLGAIGFFGGR